MRQVQLISLLLSHCYENELADSAAEEANTIGVIYKRPSLIPICTFFLIYFGVRKMIFESPKYY